MAISYDWTERRLWGGALTKTPGALSMRYAFNVNPLANPGGNLVRCIVTGYVPMNVVETSGNPPPTNWLSSAIGAVGLWFDPTGGVAVGDVPSPLGSSTPVPYWLKKTDLTPRALPTFPGVSEMPFIWEMPGGVLDTDVGRDGEPGVTPNLWLSYEILFPVGTTPPGSNSGTDYYVGLAFRISTLTSAIL
jgi:hypothetical protein